MLTDPNLRSQIEALWDKLWTGGLSNPLDAMQHEVHRTDAKHGHARVAIVRGDRFPLEKVMLGSAEFIADELMRITFLVVFEDGGIGMRFENVLIKVHGKTACARCRIAHAFARFRIEHSHHHANDVARRAELSAHSSSVEPA